MCRLVTTQASTVHRCRERYRTYNGGFSRCVVGAKFVDRMLRPSTTGNTGQHGMVWYGMVRQNSYTLPTWEGKLSLLDTKGMPHLMSKQAVLAATWRRSFTGHRVRSTSSQLKAIRKHDPTNFWDCRHASGSPYKS